MSGLPIDAILPELKATLIEQANLVMVAPPGAGKTTRVPLALLGEPWLAGRKIVMLEPRRLAARAVARYMATLLGEPVGSSLLAWLVFGERLGGLQALGFVLLLLGIGLAALGENQRTAARALAAQQG